MNDIINTSFEFHLIIYTADTKLLLADKDINALHIKTITELNLISRRMKSNRLIFNVSKTNTMLFLRIDL